LAFTLNSWYRRAVIALALIFASTGFSPAWARGERCETRSSCISLTPAQRAELASGLQAFIKEQADSNSLSGGITVGLLGQELATVARGNAEVKGDQVLPIGAKTRFPYASITKTFTAALIWKRIQEASLTQAPVIALNTPISRFIPWQNHPGLSPDFWNSITIGGLLSHTSLLPDIIDNDAAWPAAIAQGWDADRMITEVQKLPPLASQEYCNVGYTILGKILEDPRLNGGAAAPLAKILEKEIFASPAYALSEAGVLQSNRLDETFAFPRLGQYVQTENVLRNPALFFASGDVFGSLRDLGEWTSAIFTRQETWLPETFWSPVGAHHGTTDESFTYGANRENLGEATLVYKPAGFPFLPAQSEHYAYAHLLAYVPEYSLTFGFLQNGSGYGSLDAARAILAEAMKRLDALRAPH
jgi:CubicO group peptidase (beta-lactamase class C family)